MVLGELRAVVPSSGLGPIHAATPSPAQDAWHHGPIQAAIPSPTQGAWSLGQIHAATPSPAHDAWHHGPIHAATPSPTQDVWSLGQIHALIPSPTQGVWHLGPIPLRAYAICIIAGILVAIWLTERRWAQRGGNPGDVAQIAYWAVPFGVVGARLYHVATSWQPYFGPGGNPIDALYIWKGGMGVWGAIAFGALGAWIGARRAGVPLGPMADAAAPGIVLAQGIGRLGNWFNNEVYGGPTDLPWALVIHEWDQSAGRAVLGQDGLPVVLGTFHPAFLYELLWDFGVAAVVIWADRRFRLGHGRAFWLYVALYTAGRLWIEALRTDPANHILGLRLNIWTSLILGLTAVAFMWLLARRHPAPPRDAPAPSPRPDATNQ